MSFSSEGKDAPRVRELGACFAFSKADGNAWLLPRAEYPRLKTEWMAGKAFFVGRAFYGSEITVKLGDIVGLLDEPAEAMAAQRADKAADKREDDLA